MSHRLRLGSEWEHCKQRPSSLGQGGNTKSKWLPGVAKEGETAPHFCPKSNSPSTLMPHLSHVLRAAKHQSNAFCRMLTLKMPAEAEELP